MRYNSTKQNLQEWQLQSFLSSLPFWDALGGCVQWSRRETKTLKLQQATEELGRERTAQGDDDGVVLDIVANQIVEQIEAE